MDPNKAENVEGVPFSYFTRLVWPRIWTCDYREQIQPAVAGIPETWRIRTASPAVQKGYACTVLLEVECMGALPELLQSYCILYLGSKQF